MKDWAIEKGATHFTHVFYPLTGQTAEKHDSFLMPDGTGGVIAEFSGSMLIRGEPDASSFPSGGLRSTFEARGYTAWDVTSPAHIMENPNGTFLCIPTMLSWTGGPGQKDAAAALRPGSEPRAQRVLALFNIHTDLPVISYAGLEQEYFLIDHNFNFARPIGICKSYRAFAVRRAPGQGAGIQRPVFRGHSAARPVLHDGSGARTLQTGRARAHPPQTRRPPASTRSRRSTSPATWPWTTTTSSWPPCATWPSATA